MQSKSILRKLINFNRHYSEVRDGFLKIWDFLSPGEFSSLYRMVRPYTIIGNSRLRGLYYAVKRVVEKGVPGDIVECGTARGGSAALMGLTLKALGADRTLWVLDNFAGLPPPTLNDPDFEVAQHRTGHCRGDFEEVRSFFYQLGILDRCRMIKGLFQETLPLFDVKTISLLHLDVDWYESTKVCLEYLYDRVSPYGIIQIDDYGHWGGSRRAVDEFFRQRSIQTSFASLDYAGRQLVKPST